MNKKTQYIAESGVIAALYVILTYLQVLIFPESVYAAVQFRASEFLMIMCIYRKPAIAGLTVGCMISNILNAALPIDIVIGSLATLLAGISMYILRNVRIFKLPILSALMPVLFNGLLVGFEISYFLTDVFTLSSFLICAGEVALGELGVLILLGLPFSVYLEKGDRINKIFKNQI